MSTKYPGGIITKTYVAPTPSSASGIWTLDQQQQAQQAGIWPFGGPFNYIEDVFSTYLYTGTGATRTITNNIDLSTKGGLVWIKNRDTAGYSNLLIDTVRGAPNALVSNLADPQTSATYGLTAFTTSGFTLGTSGGNDIEYNGSNKTFASWTFRKQPKFFDIVTYTGDGAASRNISHALGSKPGFVVLKRTDSTGNWFVAAWTGTTFRIGTDASPFALNSTNGYNTQNGAAATSTTFDPNEVTLSSNYGVTPSNANINGATYVAYLFAHDAGGFGLTGTDNVISCGSLTADSSGNSTVTLGYEPQWVMTKRSDGVGDWRISDIMRGMSQTTNFSLRPNLSNAEQDLGAGAVKPTSTGFTTDSNITNANQTYIYVAIRRGPMAVPTTGTSVFAPYVTNTVAASASGSTSTSALYRSDFVTDFIIQTAKASVESKYALARLTGTKYLVTNTTAAEATTTAPFDSNIAALNFAANYGQWMFRRAPSFFDVVCYTGTGVARTVTHNLAAVPELMIIKSRTPAGNDWIVYAASLGNQAYLQLNRNYAVTTSNPIWNNTTPTSSVFSLGTAGDVNGSGNTQVAYLFATLAGVSKVGSYTGTDTLQTINCGFTGGARFVLIKRTNTTGNWFVWDTARGMVSGTDPSLMLNNTSAETNANSVYTIATGFQILGAPSEAINNTGDTYIFLAIA